MFGCECGCVGVGGCGCAFECVCLRVCVCVCGRMSACVFVVYVCVRVCVCVRARGSVEVHLSLKNTLKINIYTLPPVHQLHVTTPSKIQ